MTDFVEFEYNVELEYFLFIELDPLCLRVPPFRLFRLVTVFLGAIYIILIYWYNDKKGIKLNPPFL